MLSNLTSYLFGSYQNNENVPVNLPVEFNEVEEEDWMVVHALEKDIGNCENNLILSEVTYDDTAVRTENKLLDGCSNEFHGDRSRQRTNSLEDISNQVLCVMPLRQLSPSAVNNNAAKFKKNSAKSRSSSRSSSQCFMEESWFVTPPPCFVSEPYDTKPSSLENLLIEQPGMNYTLCSSVALNSYYTDYLTQLGNPANEKVKTGKTPKQKVIRTSSLEPKPADKKHKKPLEDAKRTEATVPNTSEKKTAEVTTMATTREDKRRMLTEMLERRKFSNKWNCDLDSVQKNEQKVATQFLKRNQMEKQNKVQFELTSRKKRQRRADLTKKHSGANNNRKCCY